MEEEKKLNMHLTSAAAFVEGGIQDACDDSCSICLEEFSKSDPSTVTNCKHDFHLQCILEWCQRSSQCPMCCQSISLKDPNSQELFEAVERERNIRSAPSRNTTIFHHPTLGDFEIQHGPMGINDPELEERILQHLAAMGRAHHFSRRESHRIRSSRAHQTPQLTSVQTGRTPASTSRSSVIRTEEQGAPVNNSSSSNLSSSSPNHDRAGPSEFQSMTDSLKSRFNALSMRYKDTISKSTREWKERLLSSSSTVADIGSEVRRELNAGIASVSRLMELPENREDGTTNPTSVRDRLDDDSATTQNNRNERESHGDNRLNNSNMPSSYAANPASI